MPETVRRVFPTHGGCHPDKNYTYVAVLSPRRNIITNGRAEVGPNLYARGDYTRPCYAGRWSLKRELT